MKAQYLPCGILTRVAKARTGRSNIKLDLSLPLIKGTKRAPTINIAAGGIKLETPILDLRSEVRDYMVKKNIKSALVIGTPNTLNKGLYNFSSIRCIIPNNKEVKQLSECIFNFNKGLDKNCQIKTTSKICKKYLKAGIETIILGCTEFAVMLENETFSKINTIDILVYSIINKLRECSSTVEYLPPEQKIRVQFSTFPLK